MVVAAIIGLGLGMTGGIMVRRVPCASSFSIQLHIWTVCCTCIAKLWMIVLLPQGASDFGHIAHTRTAVSPHGGI